MTISTSLRDLLSAFVPSVCIYLLSCSRTRFNARSRCMLKLSTDMNLRAQRLLLIGCTSVPLECSGDVETVWQLQHVSTICCRNLPHPRKESSFRLKTTEHQNSLIHCDFMGQGHDNNAYPICMITLSPSCKMDNIKVCALLLQI